MKKRKVLTDLEPGYLNSYGCLWVERKKREKQFVRISFSGDMGDSVNSVNEDLKGLFTVDNSYAKIKSKYRIVKEEGSPGGYIWFMKVEVGKEFTGEKKKEIVVPKKTIWLIIENYDSQTEYGDYRSGERKRGYAETETEAKKWIKRQKRPSRFDIEEIEQV